MSFYELLKTCFFFFVLYITQWHAKIQLLLEILLFTVKRYQYYCNIKYCKIYSTFQVRKKIHNLKANCTKQKPQHNYILYVLYHHHNASKSHNYLTTVLQKLCDVIHQSFSTCSSAPPGSPHDSGVQGEVTINVTI